MMTSDGLPDSYKNLFSKLKPEASKSEINRISIRENAFRKVVSGKETEVLESSVLKLVIVKTAPISRMYYAGQFVPGEHNSPTCWSDDHASGRPSKNVLEGKQHITCFDCKQNIKGSGQGNSRACRFRQRIAIMLTDDDGELTDDTVYQLDLPSTSIFGSDQKKMSMQAFAKYLNSNKTPIATVLVEARFDEDSYIPKLYFKAVRPLEENEILIAMHAQKDPDTKELVKLVFKSNTSQNNNVESVFDVVEGEGVYVQE
jgi:hypothetical protein